MGRLHDVGLDQATLPMVACIAGQKWLDLPPFRHILLLSIDTMGRCSVFQRDLARACSSSFRLVADWEDAHQSNCLFGSDLWRTYFDVLVANVVAVGFVFPA